ncbi:MAG TPA: type IX secretion system plug protein domain-containing protein [Balneolaceae bacterium]|nr:type IX secretion system plug protein domain-containing protein [Balneolaceae bacterium]
MAFLLGIGCAASSQNGNGNQTPIDHNRHVQGGFALPQQQAPPNDIQSIQFYPQGRPDMPPVIKLDSQQKLVLSFDYLDTQNRQFRVEVSHRTQTWQQSPIGPSTYLDSFYQAYIQSAKKSYSQRPTYQHVEYEFPNNELKPAVSGNYLIEVYNYNYDDGRLLFSMPFFISEEKGSIDTRVQTLFAQRKDGRPLAQLFSTYHYPKFVEYPQFDLSMSFVQNQFWGRMQKSGFLDTITPGELNGHTGRDDAFIANYEFKVLDLRSLSADGRRILSYQPGFTPPKIILRRDIQHLDVNPHFYPVTNFGMPINDRSSDYAQVEFSLETDSTVPPSADIYIVGHFNNWMINDLNKMTYDSESGMWKGQAFVKQGEYAYKYVMVDQNTIDDLALDQSFVSSQSEYLTFVYFKDPDKKFDRLLKVDRIVRGQ